MERRRGNNGPAPTVLDIEVDINLLEGYPHTGSLGVGEHDKLDVRGGLIVMQLVLAGPVGNEAGSSRNLLAHSHGRQIRGGLLRCAPVLLPSQLAHHVPQREHRSEDELRIVICAA
jgi:hypothetical protein